MRRAVLLLWPAGAALGVASESVAYRWDASGDWVPDLVTGWMLIGCGLVVWSRRSDRRIGVLMVVTGCAWFAGNFSNLALYLHRGPLVHLVLAYPSGRLTGRVAFAAVAAGYVLAAVPAVGKSEPAAIVVASLLVAV